MDHIGFSVFRVKSWLVGSSARSDRSAPSESSLPVQSTLQSGRDSIRLCASSQLHAMEGILPHILYADVATSLVQAGQAQEKREQSVHFCFALLFSIFCCVLFFFRFFFSLCCASRPAT